jgi:hypothetical protein
LLGGLRELLDGTGSQTALNDAIGNYDEMKALVKGPVPADADGGAPPPRSPRPARCLAARSCGVRG